MTTQMTPLRAGIRGAARANLVRALENHFPFVTSGALRGFIAYGDFSTLGALNDEWRATAFADEGDVAYVVMSYATPIAWVLEDGTVRVVDQKFSVTTTRHQGFVRAYLFGQDRN